MKSISAFADDGTPLDIRGDHPIKIYVKTLIGKTLEVNTKLSDTFLDIKSKIRD